MKNKKVLFIILAIVLVAIIATVAILLGGNNDSSSDNLDNKKDEGKANVEYLVDKVEIGDYVDIGIDYTNVASFESNDYTSTSKELTGWRVLAKNGSGETGTVTLVSAGCPITFRHSSSNSTNSVDILKDLYQNITRSEMGAGFKEVGFESDNLQSIFNNGKYIDLSKGVHNLGTSETNDNILSAYTAITGKTITIKDMYKQETFGTTTLKEAAGDNWKENYTDLLANGQDYWLGDETPNKSRMWRISYNGKIYEGADADYGVRPVVYLQEGVKITSGDGTSSETAYEISK